MFSRLLSRRKDPVPSSGVDRSREVPLVAHSEEGLPDSPPDYSSAELGSRPEPGSYVSDESYARASQDQYTYRKASQFETTTFPEGGLEIDEESFFNPETASIDTAVVGKPKKPKIMRTEKTPEGLTMQIFGEDIILENPELGIVILIDVTSSSGPTGLEFGKKGAKNLMWFFENIPQYIKTTEAKISWLQANLKYYLATLNGPECEGAFMVTAIKVMPNRREAIVFDIGPNELGIYHNGTTTNAKKRTGSTKSSQKGRENFAISKTADKGNEAYIVGDEINTVPFIYTIQIPEGGMIIGGSDGYQETTGQSLLSVDGQIDPAIEPKDDISCFKIRPKAANQEAQVDIAAK